MQYRRYVGARQMLEASHQKCKVREACLLFVQLSGQQQNSGIRENIVSSETTWNMSNT